MIKLAGENLLEVLPCSGRLGAFTTACPAAASLAPSKDTMGQAIAKVNIKPSKNLAIEPNSLKNSCIFIASTAFYLEI